MDTATHSYHMELQNWATLVWAARLLFVLEIRVRLAEGQGFMRRSSSPVGTALHGSKWFCRATENLADEFKKTLVNTILYLLAV
jgi:hypothetical protein